MTSEEAQAWKNVSSPARRPRPGPSTRATATAALATLERLRDDGWRSILGDPPSGSERVRLGADSVAERTETFDPFEMALIAPV